MYSSGPMSSTNSKDKNVTRELLKPVTELSLFSSLCCNPFACGPPQMQIVDAIVTSFTLWLVKAYVTASLMEHVILGSLNRYRFLYCGHFYIWLKNKISLTPLEVCWFLTANGVGKDGFPSRPAPCTVASFKTTWRHPTSFLTGLKIAIWKFKFTWRTQRLPSNPHRVQSCTRTPVGGGRHLQPELMGRLALAPGQSHPICSLNLLPCAPANTPAITSWGESTSPPRQFMSTADSFPCEESCLCSCWAAGFVPEGSVATELVACLLVLHYQSFPMNGQSVVWGKSKWFKGKIKMRLCLFLK